MAGKNSPNTTASGDLEEEELTQVTVELDDDNQETEPFIKGQDAPPPPPKKQKTPQQKAMAVTFYWYVIHATLHHYPCTLFNHHKC